MRVYLEIRSVPRIVSQNSYHRNKTIVDCLTHIYLSGNQRKSEMCRYMMILSRSKIINQDFLNIIAPAVIWINVTQSKTDLGTKTKIVSNFIFRFHRLAKGVSGHV